MHFITPRERAAAKRRAAAIKGAIAYLNTALANMPGVRKGTAEKQVRESAQPMTTAKAIVRDWRGRKRVSNSKLAAASAASSAPWAGAPIDQRNANARAAGFQHLRVIDLSCYRDAAQSARRAGKLAAPGPCARHHGAAHAGCRGPNAGECVVNAHEELHQADGVGRQDRLSAAFQPEPVRVYWGDNGVKIELALG